MAFKKQGMIPNTFYLIASKLIPALLLTLINVIFSRKLSFSDYGAYQTTWSVINVCIIIVTFGIPRYIMSFGNIWQYDRGTINKVIGFAFLFTLMPVSFYLVKYIDFISFSATVLILFINASQAFYLIQESNVISILQNQLLVKVNVIYALLLFLSHVFIIYCFEYSLIICLSAILFISIIRNIILFLSQKKYRLLSNSKIKMDVVELVWFGINDTLQVITKWFDKIILILIISAADYAIYFNGTYEIPLIGMALTAFQSIITSYGSKENIESNQLSLFKKSTSIMACILFPLSAFCFFYSNEIITLLFSSDYNQSVVLFAISSLLLPLRIASYTVLLQLKKMGKIILIGSIIDFFVAIVLMLVLYPYFKLSGLITSIVIATYFQAIFYTIFICKSYKCKISDIFEIKFLTFVLLLSFVLFFSFKHLIILNNIWFGFSIGIILFILLLVFFLNKKKIFHQIFSSKNAG